MEQQARVRCAVWAGLWLMVCWCASPVTSQDPHTNCRPPSVEPTQDFSTSVRFFRPQETVALNCFASGSEDLEFSWLKNGQPLHVESVEVGNVSDDRMFQQVMPGGSLLIFQPVEQWAKGAYQCKVTNPCGTSLSPAVQMRQALLEPALETIPRHMRVVAGSSAVLRCVPPRSVPESSVYWVLRDPNNGQSDFYRDIEVAEEDNRITTDFEGNLYITKVQADDSQDGNMYTCVATNPITRTMVWISSYTVQVEGIHAPQLASPVSLMWASPTHTLALEGQRARMKCIFSGNPLPTVNWTRQAGGDMDSTRMATNHFELTIDDVQFEDQGVYRCTGYNPETRNPIVHSFTLEVDSTPSWVNPPSDKTVQEGDDAVVQCQALGKPTPVLHWFINGVPYADLPEHSGRTLLDDRLVLTNVQLSDSQVIQCNASNVHGSVWSDVFIQVTSVGPNVVSTFPPA